MRTFALLYLLTLHALAYGSANSNSNTALEDYVDQIDSNYAWSLDSSFRGSAYTVYVLNMTSQRYSPPGGANIELWKHWVSVCVPDNIDAQRGKTAVIHIDSGSNTDRAPTTWSTDRFGYVEEVCKNTQSITVYLGQVPSQPLIFNDSNGARKTEDGILAYGWSKFLDNTDQPLWVTRLAMVKAAVRAMDTVEDFSSSLTDVPKVKNFILSGASKRGWVVWLTGAIDRRVKAIIPMMMPIQHVSENIQAIWRCYNSWGFALADYVANNIPSRLRTPQFEQLAQIEDPINYNWDLDMPKLVVVGTKDEFFLPDATRFFYNELVGEKHLVAIPNGPHGTVNTRTSNPNAFNYLANAAVSFITQVTGRESRPSYRFNLIYSNTSATIQLWSWDTPTEVRLWQGTPTHNTGRRDFRNVMEPFAPGPTFNNYFWTVSPLAAVAPGYYEAHVSAPAGGLWTGFLVDATYAREGRSFTVTSEVNVVPDTFPFPSCAEVGAC